MREAVTWVSTEELGQHAAAFSNTEDEYGYRQSRAGYGGGEPPARYPVPSPSPPHTIAVWGASERRGGRCGDGAGGGPGTYGGDFPAAYGGGGGGGGGRGYGEYDENDVPPAQHELDRLARWKSDDSIDYRSASTTEAPPGW